MQKRYRTVRLTHPQIRVWCRVAHHKSGCPIHDGRIVIGGNNEGHPLQMADEKGKPLKYSVIGRDGYNAKRPDE